MGRQAEPDGSLAVFGHVLCIEDETSPVSTETGLVVG
jgi:hypothetical protein